MLESNAIDIQYVPHNQIQAILAQLEEQNRVPLLLLGHAQQSAVSAEFTQALIYLQSGLDSVEHNKGASCYELWTAEGVWKQGSWSPEDDLDSCISFCSSDEYLIGSLSIPLPSGHSLQQYSHRSYEQIIDFIGHQDKTHLLRMWNYFPDINVENNSFERYQQFCVGRHNAFSENAQTIIQYPAASAVGSYSSSSPSSLLPKLVIVFIATKKAGVFLENPNQTSAYHYPQHYSPKSPSFARAAVYQNLNSSQLYISGTASIVGHQSQFHNDIVGQTRQTIKNLEGLIEHANSQNEVRNVFDLSDSLARRPAIKVYLRNPADLAIVSPIIEEFLPDCDNICYLHADICRQELDIEIEMLVNNSKDS